MKANNTLGHSATFNNVSVSKQKDQNGRSEIILQFKDRLNDSSTTTVVITADATRSLVKQIIDLE